MRIDQIINIQITLILELCWTGCKIWRCRYALTKKVALTFVVVIRSFVLLTITHSKYYFLSDLFRLKLQIQSSWFISVLLMCIYSLEKVILSRYNTVHEIWDEKLFLVRFKSNCRYFYSDFFCIKSTLMEMRWMIFSVKCVFKMFYSWNNTLFQDWFREKKIHFLSSLSHTASTIWVYQWTIFQSIPTLSKTYLWFQTSD